MTKTSDRAFVTLVSLYIAVGLIANVGATKFAYIAGLAIPAGSLVYAIMFTLRDLVHKRLGKAVAIQAVIMAAVCSLLMSVILFIFARIPAAPFFTLNEAWGQIMGFVPAITIGSFLAGLTSELVDTHVFEWWRTRMHRWPQFTAVVVSNAVAIPIDSILFAMLAFVILPPLFGGTAVSFADAMALTLGQMAMKAVLSLLSVPGIYLIRKPKAITVGEPVTAISSVSEAQG